MKDEQDGRTAITVRVPKELLREAKTFKDEGGSFNDLVVRALETEVRRRTWRRLLQETDELRERIYRERGLLSDSRPLIRQLREGIGRRD